MRRGLWLCFAALLLLGCLLQPSAALYACLGGWLALPLLSWGIVWFARKRVSLRMEAVSVTEKGKAVLLTVRCGRGCLPCGNVSVCLTVENSVTGERVQEKMFLQKEQTVALCSDFCGCLRCSIQKVRLWDVCGVLPVPLSCRPEKRVMIMPHTFPVEINMDSAPAQCEDCREYAQDRKGQDRTETYQLRDYTAGDSIRQIHWKLSSKRGHPVVREAACPMDQSLLLFVDRTWGSIPPAQADAIMEAAVSVAQALSEQGIPFRLCWNEDTIQMRVVGAAEELPEAVAALLKSRTVRGESGSSLYLSTCGIPTAGRILFFGTQYPEEAFLQAAPCKVLLCGMGEACFTPETAAQALRILSWS